MYTWCINVYEYFYAIWSSDVGIFTFLDTCKCWRYFLAAVIIILHAWLACVEKSNNVTPLPPPRPSTRWYHCRLTIGDLTHWVVLGATIDVVPASSGAAVTVQRGAIFAAQVVGLSAVPVGVRQVETCSRWSPVTFLCRVFALDVYCTQAMSWKFKTVSWRRLYIQQHVSALFINRRVPFCGYKH